MNCHDETWENDAPGGGRQPNFLQKLYHFLSLDPHPCPEVLYWATDSRQLVIAQPERLVQEVLPRLFKHDRLASFGRQLNIYGFSRLFPGRQFKDAAGNISDASVWAHPTLHRLSTEEEVSAVKRRAAPKLFRTRRLANGQVVRTKAGPAIEAKAREVRESIAESRRHRGSLSLESQSYAFAPNPIPRTPAYTNTALAQLSGRGSLTLMGSSTLGDIVANVAVDQSTPVTSSLMNVERRESVEQYADRPLHSWTCHKIVPNQDIRTQSIDMGQSPLRPSQTEIAPNSAPTQPALQLRALKSCPASIHTTPVPVHMNLSESAWALLQTSAPFETSPAQQSRLPSAEVATLDQSKIAAPAAPLPTDIPRLKISADNQWDTYPQYPQYPLSPSSGIASIAQTGANTPVSQAHDNGLQLSSSMRSVLQSVQASFTSTQSNPDYDSSWTGSSQPSGLAPTSLTLLPSGGTIDPRWVSAVSSTFNSVAPTPVLSPALPSEWQRRAQEAHLPIAFSLESQECPELAKLGEQGSIPSRHIDQINRLERVGLQVLHASNTAAKHVRWGQYAGEQDASRYRELDAGMGMRRSEDEEGGRWYQ